MRREATRRLKAAGFEVRIGIAGGRDGLDQYVNNVEPGKRYVVSTSFRPLVLCYTPGTAAEIVAILEPCGYVASPESVEGSVLTMASRGVPRGDGTFADVWYDSYSRSWALQIKDAAGNEIGSTEWSHAKPVVEPVHANAGGPA